MTTEELEKKLKISENTCIHCPTLELAQKVLNIFYQLDLKWCSGKDYIICTNWDSYRENTIYYPFDGEFSFLKRAHLKGYKIIHAEEFIALHTEKFDLENYTPKWELEGFPKEIIARMLDCQEEQGNPRDVTVFEEKISARMDIKGFAWDKTKEGWYFWGDVIRNKNFNHFFEKYPKKQDHQESKTAKYVQVGDNAILSDILSTQSSVEINTTEDNSQKFRVGDEVIDILTGQRGKILEINTNTNIFPICVGFNKRNEPCTLDGRYYTDDVYPRVLHYRDDYDYSIINFNNLPKRQEPKRWRAKEGEIYYSFTFDFKVVDFYDTKRSLDNKAYDSGNYFQTKEEAQKVADKLNEYFQNIILRRGEIYYSFTPNFEVEYFYDDDDIFDKKAYKLGNYFKTKEEAQEVADKLNKYFQELINMVRN